MNKARVGAVLGYVRRLAAVRKDHELPDHQLLERFAAHRDEAAFAVLLSRHGPMVLGVCHSVLHNLHDAEDAFQAAFLVLARKAASIHRREAVSSWLHRVAYHLAVKARANAARRRVLEKRATAMPSADPVLDLSLRELCEMLNEELQQLPEEYRAPLVLCCLEEKSLDEAARLLGWTRWTVKGRLQRGRERLRRRLRRRGLELSAGLFATVLSTSVAPGKVPAPLAASTVKAAVLLAAGKEPVAGVISAKVTALIQGATTTMFYSNGKIATVLLLATLVAATAFGVIRHQASAASQPAPEQIQAAKPQDKGDGPAPDSRPSPEAEESVKVRGRVLGPDGKAVSGAKLYLGYASPKERTYPVRATSGDDGRFKFTLEKPRSDDPPRLVMAVADGHGCDWVKMGTATEELTLRLVKDVPISGRILDPDGKPVVGAQLTVLSVSAAKGDDLRGYLEAVRKGNGRQYVFAKGWMGVLPGHTPVLTTGADGRFRLAGVGRERVVRLHLEGPAIATADLEVMTRAADTVRLSPGGGGGGAGGGGVGPRAAEMIGHIHGASFDYLAFASRPLRGVVRDKATGKPLAGVSVEVVYNRWCKTVTDKEGRYELRGVAKWPRYDLAVKPADGQLYFHRKVELTDTPGLDALTADIGMVQGGVTVRGKVTDKATGKPIAKARVDYHPLYPNLNLVRVLPGHWEPHSATTTGPDGSYALTVFPGAGVIGVIGPKREAYMPACVTLKERKDFFKVPLAVDRDEDYLRLAVGENVVGSPLSVVAYNALVLLEPGEKEETLVKDVALEAPQELKIRVVDPDGQPLKGVRVRGLLRYNEEILQGAEFTVRGINPKANRQLVFYHKDKNLGFFLKELRGGASEPLTIKLQACGSVSGRLVDQDKEPLAGVRLEVRGGAMAGLGGAQVILTDKKGRFQAVGLVPGQEYTVRQPFTSPASFVASVVAECGKNKDLGDVKPLGR
jgi:RNA polymerase sigma factor (sigma-70 family)